MESSYLRLVSLYWVETKQNSLSSDEILLDGKPLSMAAILSFVNSQRKIRVTSKQMMLMEAGHERLNQSLQSGKKIYAVNTGVGQSANTSTAFVEELQSRIIRMLTCGVLLNEHSGNSEDSIQHIPETWIRIALLIRIQSLIQGYSAIRSNLISNICALLQHNIMPYIPLRGSISASGDLIPLSYLAATLQGASGVLVWHGPRENRRLISAHEAFSIYNLQKFQFGPKEAVSLVNGTSVSSASAILGIHRVHGAMIQAIAITALSVEALRGSIQSFDALLSEIRPHPGQAEVAKALSEFLQDSHLCRARSDVGIAGEMYQDRYSIRTTPQWLGPELEGLGLAHNQILTECNSVTDNPILAHDGIFLQGGNFQASAITSAMDAARRSLSIAGRMIFHQVTELMSPSTSNGLPPNLTADDPSLDFLMKGIDVSIASYQSELQFLASGLSSCVVTAEQGNQSLNSLAFISARYTHKSIDVFHCLSAAAMFTLCQALDLRVVQYRFETLYQLQFTSILEDLPLPQASKVVLQSGLWTTFVSEFKTQANKGYKARIEASADKLRLDLLREIQSVSNAADLLHNVHSWINRISTTATDCFYRVWAEHCSTVCIPYLGRVGKVIYRHIRESLGIPFIRSSTNNIDDTQLKLLPLEEVGSLGKFITALYKDMDSGGCNDIIMQCLLDSDRRNETDL